MALILEKTHPLVSPGPVLALSLRKTQHRSFVPQDQGSPQGDLLGLYKAIIPCVGVPQSSLPGAQNKGAFS